MSKERGFSGSRRDFLKIAGAGAGLIAFRLGLPPEVAACLSLPEEAGNCLKIPSHSEIFVSQLKSVLTEKPKDLTSLQEWEIAGIVQEATGIPVAPRLLVRPDNQPLDSLEEERLDKRRLNQIFGRIGLEDHLYRYPGDNLKNHKNSLNTHIAPGLPAWGHLAQSKKEFEANPELAKLEEYYIAAQYLYTPEWKKVEASGDRKKLEELWFWWRYRKMLLVNPENGQAVVVIVGDGGPAEGTGKQFGGSREAMEALGLSRPTVGEVIALFVVDPKGKIPLGPVNLGIPMNF